MAYNWTVRLTDGTDIVSLTNNALNVSINDISTTDKLNTTIYSVNGQGINSVQDGGNECLYVFVQDGDLTSVGTVGAVTSITNPVKLADGVGNNLTSHMQVFPAWRALDVYCMGGTVSTSGMTLNSEYDDSEMVADLSPGLAVGGRVTGGTVSNGDFGIFKIKQSRELFTQVAGGTLDLVSESRTYDGSGNAIDSETDHALGVDRGLFVSKMGDASFVSSGFVTPGVAPGQQLPNVTPIRWIIFSARSTNTGPIYMGTAGVKHLTVPAGQALPRMDFYRGINLNSFWAQTTFGGSLDILDYFYAQSW